MFSFCLAPDPAPRMQVHYMDSVCKKQASLFMISPRFLLFCLNRPLKKARDNCSSGFSGAPMARKPRAGVSGTFSDTPRTAKKEGPSGSSQTVEKTPKSSRGPRPSRTLNRARRHARRARGDLIAGESHSPERKSLPCSFRARNPFKGLAKTGRGGSGGGACSTVRNEVKGRTPTRKRRNDYAKDPWAQETVAA